MLRVKTYLAASSIQGTGLFLGESVRAGSVLWAFDEEFDPVVPIEKVVRALEANPMAAEYVRHFGYVDIARPNYITFNVDNERFKNDSVSPNCFVRDDGASVAAFDLPAGVELTNDYEDFLADSEIGITISWRKRQQFP